jgi:hypothetical protein
MLTCRPLVYNSYAGAGEQLGSLRFVNGNNSSKRKLHIRSQPSIPVTTTLSPLVNLLFIERRFSQISPLKQGVIYILILSKFNIPKSSAD